MSGNITVLQREELRLRLLAQVESLLQKLDDAGVVRNGEQFRKAEFEIVAATDGMAGEVIKAVMEHALHDQELVTQGRLLVKQAPVRMKNHGPREVEIHPSRGAPFTVETTYYCPAGQTSRPKAKKKGSTLR